MSGDLDLGQRLNRLRLTETAAFSIESLESEYILSVAAQNGEDSGALLAATSSDYNIRIFTQKDLANIGAIKGHTDVVSGVVFGKEDNNLLFSSSHDQTVRCWDIRTGYKKEVQSFQGHEAVSNVFTTIDVSANDKLVCAGTEEDKEEVQIFFWDRRKTTLMGCYTESHQDDITQVCFHPSKPECLSTSSTDGLVCVFDLNETCEDDALMLTLNAESSVAGIGWCGPDHNCVFCLTDIGTFHVWDSQEGDSVHSRCDIKDSLLEDSSVDYLIDCISLSSKSVPLLVAGTNSGVIRVLDLSNDDITTVTSLSGGHRDRIRCCYWNTQTGRLVTGGEDSLLCLWSVTDGEKTKMAVNKNKMKSKKKTPKKGTPY